MSKMIKVGIANQHNTVISIDVVSEWQPKKITYLGTTVFFQVEDVFYSMSRVDFDEIYGIRFQSKYK